MNKQAWIQPKVSELSLNLTATKNGTGVDHLISQDDGSITIINNLGS